MGAPNDFEAASQVAFEYTSTKSIFTIEVDDKVTVKATFLSPVTPKDFKRQSLIFSYLSVDVSSKDGQDHEVQLYTDISAGKFLIVFIRSFKLTKCVEWISGNTESIAQWDSGEVDGITYHKVFKQNQQLLTETNDRAEWGNWVSVFVAADHQQGTDHINSTIQLTLETPLTNLAQMSMFVVLSATVASLQTAKIQTSAPSATPGQFSATRSTLALLVLLQKHLYSQLALPRKLRFSSLVATV